MMLIWAPALILSPWGRSLFWGWHRGQGPERGCQQQSQGRLLRDDASSSALTSVSGTYCQGRVASPGAELTPGRYDVDFGFEMWGPGGGG